MDSSFSSDPRISITRGQAPSRCLLPLLGFLCYAIFLARFMGACAGGADQSGYMNNARLLAEGRTSVAMRFIPAQIPGGVPLFTHVPLGFNPNEDHLTMNPIYPPGLPLMIMGVAQVTGWDTAPGLVMGLHALAGLLLVFVLGRTAGLGTGVAWLGVVLLAASPLFVLLSLQTMSDLPAMVWVTAAILSAYKSRKGTWLAFAAGVALSISVLVRPTNSLALLPAAIALGLSWRRWAAFLAGSLPGAIFQGAYNLEAYGRVLTTGYGDVHTLFGSHYAPATVALYFVWLPVVLTPLVLLILGLPLVGRSGANGKIAWLAVWALIFPIFYLFYCYTHNEWWGLRFALPAFPALIVGALLVGSWLLCRLRLRFQAWWLAPAALAVIVHGTLWSRALHAFSVGRSEQVYPATAAWLRDHVPANAVVAAMQTSGSLFYYTKYPVIRWDAIAPDDFHRIAAACTAAHLPVYATLFPFELEDARWTEIERRLPGHWTQIGSVRHVSLWRYDPPTVAQ